MMKRKVSVLAVILLLVFAVHGVDPAQGENDA